MEKSPLKENIGASDEALCVSMARLWSGDGNGQSCKEM